jgi:hypothetical protein
MAQRTRLTGISIEAIRPPTSGRTEVLDEVVPQLALRVSANGTKSFVVRSRIHGLGRQVRVTLGTFPSMGLQEARRAAREALNQAQRGEDPTAIKRQQVAARREEVANSFAAVAESFLDRYVRRRNNRTAKETERILRKYVLPRWQRRPIASLLKRDVVELLDRIEDENGLYMANRTLAVVRKLFNWALDERGILQSTPISRHMARGREEKRERVLRDAEIAAVFRSVRWCGSCCSPASASGRSPRCTGTSSTGRAAPG